jgi:CRP/FNR family transcriptional regulator
VSRTFSKFQDDGLLEVKQKQIRVLDQENLRRLVSNPGC